ncbi:MAG: nonstructural protein [Microviridae sp.]|nr:MAG: nonstructural protein [Microviridae sp.]
MKLQLFSVFDSKAVAFFPMFSCANIAIAQRTISDCLDEVGHPFAKNPGDYTLFHIGSFDDANAIIETLIPPRNLGILATYREPIEQIVPKRVA